MKNSFKIYFSNFFLYILMFLLIICSTFIGSSYINISEYLIYFIIILFVLPCFIFGNFNINFKKYDLLLLFVFLCIGCLSGIFNSEINLLFTASFIFIFYLIGKYFIPYNFNKGHFKRIFLKESSVFLAILLIILYFIFYDGGIPYKGIYDNPNTMGGVLATSFILMIGMIFGALESWKNKNILYLISLIVLVIFIFNILLKTASRTSVVAVGFVFLILILIFALKKIIDKKIKMVLFCFLIFSLILFFMKFYFLIIFENIILKFSNKSSSNDFFDGRGYIWDRTLNEAGFWGAGSDYFIREFSLGAHNSFISIIGRLGYIYGSLIILCWLYLGYKCFKHCLKCRGDNYGYSYLALWLGFTILSLTEVMLYKSIMLLFFLCLGGLFNEENSIRT